MEDSIRQLELQFQKADSELQFVYHMLENEFSRKFSNASGVDPVKLLHRIKRIQEELPALIEDYNRIIAAKQVVIDITRNSLLLNRRQLEAIDKKASGANDNHFGDDTGVNNVNIQYFEQISEQFPHQYNQWLSGIRMRDGGFGTNDLISSEELSLQFLKARAHNSNSNSNNGFGNNNGIMMTGRESQQRSDTNPFRAPMPINSTSASSASGPASPRQQRSIGGAPLRRTTVGTTTTTTTATSRSSSMSSIPSSSSRSSSSSTASARANNNDDNSNSSSSSSNNGGGITMPAHIRARLSSSRRQ